MHRGSSGRSPLRRFPAFAACAIAALTVTASCGSQSATSTGTSPEGFTSAAATPSASAASPSATVTVTVTVTATTTAEPPAVTVTSTETATRAAPAPAVPQPPQDDIGTLIYALSSKGPKATLTSRTKNADGTITITGVVDEQGADEYCQRYELATGSDLPACIAKVVTEQGTIVHQATADCASSILTTNGRGQ